MPFTKRNVCKDDKLPGYGGGLHSSGFIPKKKTSVFVPLFYAIARKKGGYEPAREHLGFNDAVMPDLKIRRQLSAVNARKLLDAYNKLKA